MRNRDFDKRPSGIPGVGNVPWGTHFGLFYNSWLDITNLLVAYFEAGIKNNEQCLWVVSSPMEASDAKEALRKGIDSLDSHMKAGQVQVAEFSQLNRMDGEDAAAITAYINAAIFRGFRGLRLACNVIPEKPSRKGYACFGEEAICDDNALAIYAYPRKDLDAAGIMNIVKKHRLALVNNVGKWEVLESSEAQVSSDELKRNEKKLRGVFQNMSEGFAFHRIVLDDNGEPCDYIFLEVNDAFEKLTKLKAGNVIGKRVTQVLPGIEKDPTDWIGKYGSVALSGKPISFESYAASLGRWYSVSAFSSQRCFFVAMFTDITERKQMEDALERRAKDLAAANKELESFAYSISHDLRAPLRAMKSFSGILMEDYSVELNEDAKSLIRHITASADRMNALIEDMLNLAKISRETMKPEEMDLSLIAESVVYELRQAEPARNVEAVIPNTLPTFADPRLMHIALSNLIGNAWKYSGKNPKSRIEIGSLENGGGKVLFVRDNGAGFDMSHAKKLFVPFQRLHPDSQFPGTGIGLAIVHRVIQRHNGRIWAESEIGKGATFYFTLSASAKTA